MTEGHTHRVVTGNWVADEYDADWPVIQDLPCATPATCDTAKLGRAVELLRIVRKDGFVPLGKDDKEWYKPDLKIRGLIDDFLASLSSEASRSSAEMRGKANGKPPLKGASQDATSGPGSEQSEEISGSIPLPRAQAEDTPP